jgi:precorrin-6A/cobalt-precorrin-6A reductase
MTVLLLAGTGEARALAAALAVRNMPVIASLAGAVRQPAPQGVPTRIGGFGGEAGFVDYVQSNGIRALVDATHPFAAAITARTGRVCAGLGMPCLRLERPGWMAEPGDRWTWIGSEAEVMDHIGPGEVVFLSTGRQTLDLYAGLAHATLWCRQIDPATRAFPFPNGGFVIGRPPFSVAAEIDLFERLGINWLIAKDAGGTENRTKLEAARMLGLPVLMIRRPPPPPGLLCVRTVEDAVNWVLAL